MSRQTGPARNRSGADSDGANAAATSQAPTGAPTHRERLLDALLESIRQKGFRDTMVADIVRLARTSRRTFYAEFATREECYIALMDAGDVELRRQITDAVDVRAPWLDQVRQAVTAYIDYSIANPDLVLSSIRELPGLGEAGRQQQRRAMDAFADFLVRLEDNPQFREAGLLPMSRTTALLFVGGIRELTAVLVENGDDLREILETVVDAAAALLRRA